MNEITNSQAMAVLLSLPPDRIERMLYTILYSQGSVSFLDDLEASLQAARCDLRRAEADSFANRLFDVDGRSTMPAKHQPISLELESLNV